MNTVENTIAMLSADEIVKAVTPPGMPAIVNKVSHKAVKWLSRSIGKRLAQFDSNIVSMGLPRSAHLCLDQFGVKVRVSGLENLASKGPLLVIANHPGAYDALVLFAQIGRNDLMPLAKERDFLRALPNLSERIAFLADAADSHRSSDEHNILKSSGALRRVDRHLSKGGSVLQFAAGDIEPDPAFASNQSLLGSWQSGTGLLARLTKRAGGRIVLAGVSAVHSERAKRLSVVKWAEKQGHATISGLVQIAVPGFREVQAQVRFLNVTRYVSVDATSPVVTDMLRRAALDLINPAYPVP